METSVAPDETLADVLGARARRTPTDRLALDAIGGLLIGAAAIWARPKGWFPLLAAASCFACYGCWAFAERRLNPATEATASATGPGWRVVWQVTAVLGLLAFVTLLFALLGVGLGPLIS